MRLADGVERGALAFAAEDLPLGVVQVPQQFALAGIAHLALYPDDGGVTCALGDRGDMVQGVGRVGDGGSGVQLEPVFHAVGIHHQIAAGVALGVGHNKGDGGN